MTAIFFIARAVDRAVGVRSFGRRRLRLLSLVPLAELDHAGTPQRDLIVT